MTPRTLAIVGAGGHGRVVAETLLSREHDLLLFFVDEDEAKVGAQVINLDVRGSVRDLVDLPHDGVIIAVGDNRSRARIHDWLLQRQEKIVCAIHERAWLSPSVSIGDGTVIFGGGIVNAGTLIGCGVIVNTGATVDHDCSVFAHAHIGPGAHVAGRCTIGQGVLLATGVVVGPGCNVGAGSIVGAGSTVLDDIPPGVVAVGSPARIIRPVS